MSLDINTPTIFSPTLFQWLYHQHVLVVVFTICKALELHMKYRFVVYHSYQ